MNATYFTPYTSILGGILIGAAAVLLMAFTGRIAGVSGFVSRLLPPYADDQTPVRLAFVAGLLAAAPLYTLLTGGGVPHTVTGSSALLVAGGLLVGFGTVTGSGCTSGHGVCGIARLSPRSLVATASFMATGIATVFVARHLLGV
jgi:uncharacterized membrane protein YedE/YeeE